MFPLVEPRGLERPDPRWSNRMIRYCYRIEEPTTVRQASCTRTTVHDDHWPAFRVSTQLDVQLMPMSYIQLEYGVWFDRRIHGDLKHRICREAGGMRNQR